ncbi:MAG: aminotransferase class V-fold PLP-dependent enzyme [Spirochaetia bacterium]|nr:aminotransferase class V-fold PLP-dependent enzyme [Spirochaetia bacterium]
MNERIVYMDNNATTPIAPEVKEVILQTLDIYGNASSMHGPGRLASAAVSHSRGKVASLIGAQPEEIVFTGGGSESNNTVLNLVFSDIFDNTGRNRIVTTRIEHPSIYETVQTLTDKGIEVTFIDVDGQGNLKMDDLAAAMGDDVAIVSVMMANNEIGTILDVSGAARLAHACGALMHTDAVQAVGKIPVDVRELDVDFLSLSGHKLYAPKGIGALYIKKGIAFCPLIHGGHQEAGRRAGTYNNTGIIALGTAAELAAATMAEEMVREGALRDRLREGLLAAVPDITVNGNQKAILPGTLNVSFPGAEGESILLYLDLEGIAVSTGSACATGSLEPSYVLTELGLGPELAHSSIRFSLGSYNTVEDVDYVLERLPPIIKKIREMSTL